MSQALLFSIGLCVFAVTVYGALFYGYFVFNRFYDSQVASEGSPLAASVAPAVAVALLTAEAAPTI